MTWVSCLRRSGAWPSQCLSTQQDWGKRSILPMCASLSEAPDPAAHTWEALKDISITAPGGLAGTQPPTPTAAGELAFPMFPEGAAATRLGPTLEKHCHRPSTASHHAPPRLLLLVRILMAANVPMVDPVRRCAGVFPRTPAFKPLAAWCSWSCSIVRWGRLPSRS